MLRPHMATAVPNERKKEKLVQIAEASAPPEVYQAVKLRRAQRNVLPSEKDTILPV